MRSLDITRENDTDYLLSLTTAELREFNRLRDDAWQSSMRAKGYSVSLAVNEEFAPSPEYRTAKVTKVQTSPTTTRVQAPKPRRLNMHGVEDAPSVRDRILALREKGLVR